MPTSDWLEERTKLSVYVGDEINDALKAWMEQNRIKKVTRALTIILEQHLGLAEAPQQTAPGSYATLEQLQELVARVEALEKGGNPKKTKAKPTATPQPEATGQLTIESASSGDWMHTQDAHKQYASEMKYNTFRKMTPEAMLEKFGLEADPSRKGGRGPSAKAWIRKA